jgi:peptidoglycan/LPS O-acetylase OafA/YrhL
MTEAKPVRLLNLDLLRLVSALLVLFFHYGFRMQITGEGAGIGFPELAPLAKWFDIGLLIFFAISGYVIMMSAEGRSAFDFAVGRFARLWPTFVVCATITAVVLSIWPAPAIGTPTIQQWLAHVVILSRALGQPFLDGAYWTIAYEIIFYGWIFMFIATGLLKLRWRTIVTVWLAISVLNETALQSVVLQKLLITQYSGYFAFGLALYRAGRENSRASFAVLGCAAAWAIAAPFMTEADFLSMYGLDRSAAGLAAMGPLALAAVTIAVYAPTLPIRKGLAISLGGLTYPLYLLHQNIGYAAFANFGTPDNRFAILAVLIGVLVVVALVIARTVEPAARRAIIGLSKPVQASLTRLRARFA